jgi:hypothetical protein
MSKLLALLATIKAILIVPAVMFAAGDRVPVILISLLFNLAELGAKPSRSDGATRYRHRLVEP